jgi:hypothetical protein
LSTSSAKTRRINSAQRYGRHVGEERFDFRRVLESAFELFRAPGIERDAVPLIPAGGINSHEKVAAVLEPGAAAVQVGTPFAVTEEADVHPNFKRVPSRARADQIITFTSAAGLPARAVLTPWLGRYLEMESRLQERAGRFRDRCASAFNGLSHCGQRDGIAKTGQFCIDAQLAAALKGDVERGLFFRSSEACRSASRSGRCASCWTTCSTERSRSRRSAEVRAPLGMESTIPSATSRRRRQRQSPAATNPAQWNGCVSWDRVDPGRVAIAGPARMPRDPVSRPAAR